MSRLRTASFIFEGVSAEVNVSLRDYAEITLHGKDNLEKFTFSADKETAIVILKSLINALEME